MQIKLKLTKSQVELVKKSRNHPVLILSSEQVKEMADDIEKREDEILNS